MKIDPSLRNQYTHVDAARAVKISNFCLGCGAGIPHHRAKRCAPCGYEHGREQYRKNKADQVIRASLRRHTVKAKIIARHLGIGFEAHRTELIAAVVEIVRRVRKEDPE